MNKIHKQKRLLSNGQNSYLTRYERKCFVCTEKLEDSRTLIYHTKQKNKEKNRNQKNRQSIVYRVSPHAYGQPGWEEFVRRVGIGLRQEACAVG